MLKEFKEFAFKGNLVDMAVGFILGGAFATVIKSLVSNVIMPPIGLMLSNVDYKNLKYTLKPAEGDKPEVAINVGLFITDLISFTLLALVVFIVVKKFITAFEKKKEEKPAAPPKQEVLLEAILDELKKR
ncbi:large-conductance mechanosensitive channel [Rubritalea halochordaticola]|uniref:Large-conductance mechanosensitive channel n=1 Tax=Rubritalea halochordaticola TaxID=714537 RepID=A0ABP9V352_9BACT